MKTFEEYLDQRGYSWNDFDNTYEMENLIEQYADEKVKQALTMPAFVGQSEQLLEEQINWLMANTSLEVEKIVDFKEHFK